MPVASHLGTSWSLQKADARHNLVPATGQATNAAFCDYDGYGAWQRECLRGGLHQMRLERAVEHADGTLPPPPPPQPPNGMVW